MGIVVRRGTNVKQGLPKFMQYIGKYADLWLLNVSQVSHYNGTHSTLDIRYWGYCMECREHTDAINYVRLFTIDVIEKPKLDPFDDFDDFIDPVTLRRYHVEMPLVWNVTMQGFHLIRELNGYVARPPDYIYDRLLWCFNEEDGFSPDIGSKLYKNDMLRAVGAMQRRGILQYRRVPQEMLTGFSSMRGNITPERDNYIASSQLMEESSYENYRLTQ